MPSSTATLAVAIAVALSPRANRVDDLAGAEALQAVISDMWP